MSKSEELIKLIKDTTEQIEKLKTTRKNLAIKLANVKDSPSIKAECLYHGMYKIELLPTQYIAMINGGKEWDEMQEHIDTFCPTCWLEQKDYTEEDPDIICGCGCGY